MKKAQAFKKLKITYFIPKLIFLFGLLVSCQTVELSLPASWNIYHNPRYSFEFPYPSNWVAYPMPDNSDGRAFYNPQNPLIEIRGWAGSRLQQITAANGRKHTVKKNLSDLKLNFVTEQGQKAQLQVKLNSHINVMELTLVQGALQYNWQGQAPSQLFADYYRFFYYIASQYRISR